MQRNYENESETSGEIEKKSIINKIKNELQVTKKNWRSEIFSAGK